MSTNHPKKMSTSIIVFAACVIGIAIGLFGLNYWHASKCSSGLSNIEIEIYIDALNRRLLQAESQVYKNEILINKIISTIENKLIKLESNELDLLSKQSQEEAIKIALKLSNYPAPPIPEFELDEIYNNPENLANLVDDIFSKLSNGEEIDTYVDSSTNKNDKIKVTISDAEAKEKCLSWKDQYQVVVGISWGNLPFDLQQQWLSYSCDYHLG